MSETDNEVSEIKVEDTEVSSSNEQAINDVVNGGVKTKTVRRPKTFGENWEVKAVKLGAKLTGKGLTFGAKKSVTGPVGFARDTAEFGMALGKVSLEAVKLLKKGVTRETLLSATLIGSALGGGFAGGKAYDDYGQFKRDVQGFMDNPAHVLRLDHRLPSQVEFDRLVGEKNANEIVDKVVDVYYQGMEGEERERLKSQVELMSIYMADIITVEGFENVAKNAPKFQEACAAEGVAPRVVEAISFAETGGGVLGKLKDKTAANALGPMGITDGLALDFDVPITNDENDPRLDWGFSIQFACKRIGEYTRNLGDVSLATAAYHRGPKAVEDDIRFWAAANGLTVDGTIAEFVKAHSLNDWKLRQNKELRESWETKEADDTNIYATRVAGSDLLLENVNALAKKQKESESASLGN